MPLSRTLPVVLAAWVALAGVAAPCLAGSEEDKQAEHGVQSSDATSPSLSEYYGFREPELYRLDQRMRGLRAADLNADGRTDLAVIDNAHSRLDVLIARDKQAQTNPPVPSATNEISDSWRFRLVKVPVNREITSLAVGDFDGDGRADFVYVAVPSEIVVRFQDGEGEWSRSRRIAIADLPQTPDTIAAGDLNGDGRDDVVLLGTSQTYVFYQDAEGKLGDPLQLSNTAGKLQEPYVGDVNGDGRNDLVYQTGDDASKPLCVRFQDANKHLGPERRFELPEPRQVRFADVDGKPGLEVLTLENRTNRCKVHTFKKRTRADDESETPEPGVGPLVFYGLGSDSSGRDRRLAVGDLDGDGLKDVVVSDPASAQLTVYRQSKGLGLENGESFPGLIGVKALCLGDVDGDGRDEVVLASDQEKALGLCRLEEGRLSFPTALPVASVPVAAALADLDGNGSPEVVYVAREGSSNAAKYQLRALVRTSDGRWQSWTFGDKGPDGVALNLRGDPEGLAVLDANQDGRPDYLLFAGFGRPPTFLSTNDSGLPVIRETDAGLGIGGAAAGGVFVGDLEGPVLLVAQKNFARNVTLDAEGRWQVLDQFNGPSGAKVSGVAVLDADGDGVAEIVLVDEGSHKLRFLKRREQVYRAWKELDLGSFVYKGAHVADLNGDGADDLLVFGEDKFGVVYSGSNDWVLDEVASFESALKDVRFTDVMAGDLNADGRMDLALIDAAEQYLQIVTIGDELHLLPALCFKVFESKSFRGALPGGNEPREGLLADVTGDGRNDVVLLVHDRILVYPQDDGSGSETEATKTDDK